MQELSRYNKLLQLIRNNLNSISRAFKGQSALPKDLDSVVTSLSNNQIPEAWVQKSYPSTNRLVELFILIIFRLNICQI